MAAPPTTTSTIPGPASPPNGSAAPASSSSSAAASPAPTATEIVTRPEPGIARGKWEAPPWMFWTVLGVVAVAMTLYALRRFGLLGGKAPPRGSLPPPSHGRGSRPPPSRPRPSP